MVTHLKQNTSDNESLKSLMISFVCKSLALTLSEEQSLIKNSHELANNSTLPDLITHLKSKKIETELIEKISLFGRNE